MATSAEQSRAWSGLAVFSFGFRPFFLAAGLWATTAMIVWMLMLSGAVDLPTAFDPVSWHAHEFLFGYVSAAVTGFLLTAVPNWTGRLPIVGWPLVGLCVLWVAGRVACGASAYIPPEWVAVVDLSLLSVLLMAIGREIVTGKNWRNLPVLVLLAALVVSNGLFHIEAIRGDHPASGYGFRMGLGIIIMMIVVIGGRIVPSFTRNWLAKRNSKILPTPFGNFDKFAVLLMAAAIIVWITTPDTPLAASALLTAGFVHLVRLLRWAGYKTGHEPLVWVLHLGYLCIPLGAIAMGCQIFWPYWIDAASVQHIWMAGAIGIMTLAVMTRATRGHTGHVLSADHATTAFYVLLAFSVILRIASALIPSQPVDLLALSALAWIAAFAGFTVYYGRMLLAR